MGWLQQTAVKFFLLEYNFMTETQDRKQKCKIKLKETEVLRKEFSQDWKWRRSYAAELLQ